MITIFVALIVVYLLVRVKQDNRILIEQIKRREHRKEHDR